MWGCGIRDSVVRVAGLRSVQDTMEWCRLKSYSMYLKRLVVLICIKYYLSRLSSKRLVILGV